MAISRKRFVIFAVAAATLMTTVVLVGLLAVDMYLHQRAERSAGLNRWGYRGPVIGRKQPHEIRVVMLGGSTVFGYGGQWDEAAPAALEQELNRSPAGVSWRVINLGYNTEGAFAFRTTLDDFAFLNYDVVILYEGYNDLLGDASPNTAVVRHQSPVFRLTGYLPILPLVFREKAMSLRAGGNIGAAYAARLDGAAKPVFTPSISDRTSAAALDVTASVAASLERQLGRFSDHVPQQPVQGALGCPKPWVSYCESQHRAIEYATSLGKGVLVVSQPRLHDERPREWHDSQQNALATMVASRFARRGDVAYTDLREAVDVSNDDLSFDQMHLTAAGNRIVAAALAGPVKRLHSK